MKKLLAVITLVLFLSGCGDEEALVSDVMNLRSKVEKASSCSFHASVAADYGEEIYAFEMDCVTDAQKNMRITITEPETISGITAEISGSTGKLVFDDKALLFEMVADGQLAPVCTPWLVIDALRSAYISLCSKTEQGIVAYLEDSFHEADYKVELYLGSDNLPYAAEVLWQGRRILSMEVKDFVIS